MFDRLLSVVVAATLAVLIWLYVRSREHEVLDNVTLPVEVTLAPAMVDTFALELTGPSQVTLSFSGPPQRMRELHGMLQRKELTITKEIALPEERRNVNHIVDAVVIESGDVNPPPGVTMVPAEGRNRVPYVLHRMVEKELPVQFDRLRRGLTNLVKVSPATVRVRGPREVVERARYIPTQPSELPVWTSKSETATARAVLVTELEGRPVRVSPSEVTIRLEGEEHVLKNVPVKFLVPPGFPFRPGFPHEGGGKIELRLIGPKRYDPPRVQAYVDLTKGRYLSGINKEPLEVHAPADFVVTEKPQWVSFQLDPGDWVPDGLGLPLIPAVRPTVP